MKDRPFPSDARLGPYQLLGPLGAGGMGEVYKARDTRLDRIVAIKILPAQFAADPGRRDRFEREARAVAALNHPHICNLYDVGDSPNPQPGVPDPDSVRFLVMEYLEGQTLADRLVRGALPIADVLRYATELADALDHAHRRGLVHRDLKPGNVMLTRGGTKLLDFGLSRLQASPDLLALSTISPGDPLTAEGAVIGTFPYMAPEQLAGREADARSDIFAFGALLYEMATGHRAFEGTTAATVIGAILHTDPPALSSLEPLVPPALDRLISRCLAKDPDDRWQTSRDLTLELKWIADDAASTSQAARPPDARRMMAVMTVALSVLALAFAATVLTVVNVRRASDDTSPARLSFSPPEGLTLAGEAIGGLPAISPDGRRLAFVATGPDHTQLLWVRPLDALAAQALPGTDGAESPFWSPDSQFIGFFAQRKLKKVPVSGGALQTLCDAVQPRGGAWNAGGIIVFSANSGHQLYRIAAGGGPAMPIAADGQNEERYWPTFLPDGRHYIYRGRPQKHGIFAGALDSPEAKLLLENYVGAAYSRGYLLGLIGSSPGAPFGTLFAHSFDAQQLQITGDPLAVAEQVAYRNGMARGAFSVSENGTLVYRSLRTPTAQLIWFDRRGKMLRNVGGSVTYNSPALSPDEKTVAVERFDPEAQSEDLWLIDVARDVPSRFTSYPNSDTAPVWSPDGTRIAFQSPRGTPPNLYQKTLSGEGREELLVESIYNKRPSDWSRDGRSIVYATLDPNTQWDLWILPMSDPPADRKVVPFLRSRFNEASGQFSPDGRWLAYVSDESGTNEVYVRTFPEAGSVQRLSANGGSAPRWRGDGRELFYLGPDGKLMAVSVTPAAALLASAPVALFETRIAGVGLDNWGFNDNFVVSRDGQRFLINTVAEDRAVPTTVLLHWPAALRR